MKQVLICDNNPAFMKQLKNDILQYLGSDCIITMCDSAQSLRAAVAQQQPDIALMDILLNADNGIALTKELFPAGSGTAVIFITGYVEYCTDVYEAEHVYFLQKPIRQAQLKRALDKALACSQSTAVEFSVRIGGALRRVKLSEIMCIESFYRKLRIHLQNENIECYGTLNTLPPMAQEQLLRCHKSFLVNPKHIQSLEGRDFLLADGTRVPISRTYYINCRQRFLDYCAKRLEVC